MNASALRLSVVVPAFNEAARIGSTLRRLQAHLPSVVPSWEIRVVDDGSTDNTPQLVEEAAAADPHIVLQREPHRGKGGAVRHGMLAATGELRFMCDADLSMPVSEITRFLAVVPARCDIAIGSREGASANRIGEPHYRHVMGRVFNMLVRMAALPGLNDTQCGFKMFTAHAAEVVFSRVTLDGWAFDIEALFIARRAGLKVLELPIEWHYRAESQVSAVRDAIRMAHDVIRIRRNARRGLYD